MIAYIDSERKKRKEKHNRRNKAYVKRRNIVDGFLMQFKRQF